MSLQAFQVYASLWLLCSTVVMLFTFRVAAAPWLPAGEPPEYALWLLRATDAKPPPACRITVRDLSGREVVVTRVDACDGASARAQPVAAIAQASPRTAEQTALLRTLASSLHSVLVLALGGLASWGLRNVLRRTFRRPAGFAWVSRGRE